MELLVLIYLCDTLETPKKSRSDFVLGSSPLSVLILSGGLGFLLNGCGVLLLGWGFLRRAGSQDLIRVGVTFYWLE